MHERKTGSDRTGVVPGKHDDEASEQTGFQSTIVHGCTLHACDTADGLLSKGCHEEQTIKYHGHVTT